MPDFSSLSLPAALLQATESLGYTTLTPVQEHALPPLLAGRDVIAQARTGSGKTVAFGLGLLARVDATAAGTQALVLCPTRELADQVAKEIRRLARALPNLKLSILCGGVPLRVQSDALAHAPHVVVGTPGRIQEHLDAGNLDFSTLQVLVLDEADRMLDMGFEEAIAAVAAQTPKTRQTLLFSATYADEIRVISRKFQRDPVEVTVDTAPAEVEIAQRFHEVEPRQKLDALTWLLAEHRPESALVFCNTRRDTSDVADELARRGYAALALHGDLEQRDRDEVLLRFANRSCTVLVATDVAARGLDIDDLAAVVNYDVPSDADIYVHRIGRTGRAGRRGLALTLCTPAEAPRANVIEARVGKLDWQRIGSTGERRRPPPPTHVTLVVDGGRKDKIRPTDILGALTAGAGVPGDAVGKIDIFDVRAYVAVKRELANQALERLRSGKIKGRSLRVRRLG